MLDKELNLKLVKLLQILIKNFKKQPKDQNRHLTKDRVIARKHMKNKMSDMLYHQKKAIICHQEKAK